MLMHRNYHCVVVALVLSSVVATIDRNPGFERETSLNFLCCLYKEL